MPQGLILSSVLSRHRPKQKWTQCAQNLDAVQRDTKGKRLYVLILHFSKEQGEEVKVVLKTTAQAKRDTSTLWTI